VAGLYCLLAAYVFVFGIGCLYILLISQFF
jgi:hypothetical protein